MPFWCDIVVNATWGLRCLDLQEIINFLAVQEPFPSPEKVNQSLVGV